MNTWRHYLQISRIRYLITSTVVFHLILIFLLAGCIHVAADGAELDGPLEIEKKGDKHFVEARRSFEDGNKLTLRNSNGAIEIKSWDKNEVLILAEKHVRVNNGFSLFSIFSSKRHYNDEDKQELLDKIIVDIEQNRKKNELNIDTQYPKRPKGVNMSVQYEIRMPRNANLDIGTSNGAISVETIDGEVTIESSNGRLEAKRINGNIQAKTSNGAIICKNVSGEIDASTSNGAIEIDYSGELLPSNDISCETSNGSIEVSLPEGGSFELEASTSNGRVSCDFYISEIYEKSKNELSGIVGEGKPMIQLETSNGSIEIDMN